MCELGIDTKTDQVICKGMRAVGETIFCLGPDSCPSYHLLAACQVAGRVPDPATVILCGRQAEPHTTILTNAVIANATSQQQ